MTETLTKHARHAPAERALVWLLAILMTVSIEGTAAAFDCLPYKPKGARGRWHAEVVAGKICWYGANWRSFLPKNARAERTAAPNKKGVDPTAIPEQPVELPPVPGEITEAKAPEDLPGLREATPTEAAALINSVSLEFQPISSEVPEAPHPIVAQDGSTKLTMIFGALAIGAVVLATLIYKWKKRRTAQRLIPNTDETKDQPIECADINNTWAPSLQPSAINEHKLVEVPVWLKRAETEC